MRITKVVVFSAMNPTKLVLHFSDFQLFSTEFTRISKLNLLLKLQFCAEVLGKNWGQAMWPLTMAGGVEGQNSGDSGEGFDREVVGEGARAHIGSIRAGIRGWKAGGERGRRRGLAVAAAASIPARFPGMQGNTRAFELL
jgi:hypothetical protein